MDIFNLTPNDESMHHGFTTYLGIMIKMKCSFLIIAAVFASVGLMGCEDRVRLIRDTPSGGTIVYPIGQEIDILSSPERGAAIGLMRQKCPAGFQITREGEVAKLNESIDRNWRGQLGDNRLWALQFSCR